MDSLARDEIEAKLDRLLEFLNPLRSLLNAHVNSFFTDDHWTLIPAEWKKKLSVLSKEELTLLPSGKLDLEWLQNISELILPRQNRAIGTPVKEMKGFAMSSKKKHEIEIFASLINEISKAKGIRQIVDAGSGRGYLSQTLASDERVRVLAIEGSSQKTKSGKERESLLERKQKKSKLDNHKTITHWITNETTDFLADINEDEFLDADEAVGLVGLHACGSLSSSLQEIYLSSKSIRCLCYVGCCYHLDEKFPLSSHLKRKRVEMSRNERMIAQSAPDKDNYPSSSLFYRAVLEVFLRDRLGMGEIEGTKYRVGKLYRRVDSFPDYVFGALDHPCQFSRDDVTRFYEDFEPLKKRLEIFCQIQSAFGPCLESLILMDRLLHLLESHDVVRATILPVFDSKISPRNQAIISWKSY